MDGKSSTSSPTINYTVRVTCLVMVILILEIFLGCLMYSVLKSDFHQAFVNEVTSGVCKEEIRRILKEPEFADNYSGTSRDKQSFEQYIEFSIPNLRRYGRYKPGGDSEAGWTDVSRVPLETIQEFCKKTVQYCPKVTSRRRRRQLWSIVSDAQAPKLSLTNSHGPSGPPGPPGVKGEPGNPGLKSENGKQRIVGYPGPPGTNGIPGRDGIPGLQGKEGPVGPTGPRGYPGAPGPQGGKGNEGKQGLSGLSGIPGDKGQKGIRGPVGIPGPLGHKGDTGNSGIPGLGGLPGKKGNAGESGRPGIPGYSGEKGDKGELGALGLPGVPGIKGDIGKEGLPGYPGIPGGKGNKGDLGYQGLSGIPGTKGDKGERGIRGIPGPTGFTRPYSVCGSEIPVEASNTSILKPSHSDGKGIVGPPGPPGKDGIPGPPGEVGLVGPPGPSGQPGLPGVQGQPSKNDISGPKGEVGPMGPPGPPGFPGLPGAYGEKGNKGEPGHYGVPGIPGIKGDIGDLGPQGPPGATDGVVKEGPPGIPGIPGQKGDKGDAGPLGPHDIGILAEKGDKGDAGHPGLHGSPGSKGEQGERGVSGATLFYTIKKPVEMATSKPQGCSDRHRFSWKATKYGNAEYVGLPARTAKCILRAIGEPKVHGFFNEFYGSWMVDSCPPTEFDAGDKAWVTTDEDHVLFEYEELSLFVLNRSYPLNETFRGNAHVIYKGSFFYQPAQGKPRIIKYSLHNQVTQTVEVPGLTVDNSKLLYTTGYNYLDFSVDENGLWVIFAVPDSHNTAVIKVDAHTMTPQYIWNITADHLLFNEMFVISGILYGIDNITEDKIRISFVMDLYTAEVSGVDIDITKQFGLTTMATYDHRKKQLMALDKGWLLSYPITCENLEPKNNDVPAE